jgi:hypothetical protein
VLSRGELGVYALVRRGPQRSCPGGRGTRLQRLTAASAPHAHGPLARAHRRSWWPTSCPSSWRRAGGSAAAWRPPASRSLASGPAGLVCASTCQTRSGATSGDRYRCSAPCWAGSWRCRGRCVRGRSSRGMRAPCLNAHKTRGGRPIRAPPPPPLHGPAPPAPAHEQVQARAPQHRLAFYLGFSLVFILVLHGACSLYVFGLCCASYALSVLLAGRPRGCGPAVACRAGVLAASPPAVRRRWPVPESGASLTVCCAPTVLPSKPRRPQPLQNPASSKPSMLTPPRLLIVWLWHCCIFLAVRVYDGLPFRLIRCARLAANLAPHARRLLCRGSAAQTLPRPATPSTPSPATAGPSAPRSPRSTPTAAR